MSLNALGYDAALCLTDFGETAETVLRERLKKKAFDCILVGADLQLIAQNTPCSKGLSMSRMSMRCRRNSALTARWRVPPRRSNDVFLPANRTDRHHDRALILF